MSKELLQKVIDKGVEGFLNEFFQDISKYYTETEDDLSEYDGNGFSNFQTIGEINFSPSEKLVVVTANIAGDLTERSGKKAQYEKAKKILKAYMRYDASIFIFSDPDGNFRLSLVYGTPDATRLVWSNFRRFTYFVSKTLTNRTFLDRVGTCSFASLEVIKDAFSVEKVTKLFYSQIADWYFWAVKEVTFPKDAEAEPEGRNISVIRLITRLIFIWFMKERGLVSSDFFDKQQARALLKSLQDGETTYYKAILQNLFFATLNTKIEERNFRFKAAFHGKNDDYMDHTIYRYETYFKNQETMLELFKDIPFLNGGLFDCLDRRFVEDGKNLEMRNDGFSDNEVGLKVPNKLFFSDEIEVDLNEDYGTTNKRYKSQGLLNILSAYNFTIDENDPNDQEVALDPELLGKVFENLLASYNPDTATTARKATGSYYTPREIVDYMVTESLKQYFKTHLQDIADIDDKLGSLFSTSGEEPYNPLGKADTKRMVTLIDDLRIVDPAVGSGAFPMGVLNKLVHILAKLDPDNKLWKETQLKVVEGVPDPIIKQNLKAQITARFAEKNANYGRKLYLIQNVIYGVDIQQIAIEIAKLRFFIALLVDEKIDKSKYNWGVEPLPNLDFKLMQGNSLVSEFMGINLDADNSQSYGKLMKDELDVLIDEFQNRKSDFQSETDPKKKSQLKKTVENLIIKIFEGKLKEQKAGYLNQLKSIENKYSYFNNDAQKNQLITKEVQDLNRKSGFDLKAAEKQLRDFTTGFIAKPFFSWKLYFAEVFHENDGFDIVISNPPYGVKFTEHEKELFLRTYFHQDYQLDSYLLFLEKAFVFLCQEGVLTFIIPNPWLTNLKTKKIRRYVFSNHTIQEINHYSRKVFDAVVDTEVVVILKRPPVSNSVLIHTISSTVESTTNIVPQQRWREMDGEPVNIFLDGKQELLARKIRGSYDLLGKICKIAAGVKPYEVGKGSPPQTQEMVNKRVYDATFQKDKTYSPILRGRDIEKYLIKWDGKRWIKYGENLAAPRKLENFLTNRKIVIRQTGDSLVAAFDTSQFICMNNMHTINSNDSKYDLLFLLGLINSSLLTYYFQCLNPEKGEALAEVKKENVEKLPIASASTDQQKPIIQLVQKLITAKKQDPEADSTVVEHQIDQMVFELYGLTPEEKAVVEGENNQNECLQPL